MSLSTASVGLASALKTAHERWEDTRPLWDDAVSRDFEANHWLVLKNQVEATLNALDRLAPVLARAVEESS
jgi:hypothetical protein